MPTDFGGWLRKRLRELRDRGVSQSDLADIIGVDKQTVSSWKLDRTVPRRAQRRRAERVIEELLRGNEASGDGVTEVAEPSSPYGEESTLVRLNPAELAIIQSIRRLVGEGEESA